MHFCKYKTPLGPCEQPALIQPIKSSHRIIIQYEGKGKQAVKRIRCHCDYEQASDYCYYHQKVVAMKLAAAKLGKGERRPLI